MADRVEEGATLYTSPSDSKEREDHRDTDVFAMCPELLVGIGMRSLHQWERASTARLTVKESPTATFILA